jgi:hypothetical protein
MEPIDVQPDRHGRRAGEQDIVANVDHSGGAGGHVTVGTVKCRRINTTRSKDLGPARSRACSSLLTANRQ